jgi:hypothetical protein
MSYQRMNALVCAGTFWDRVCPDGRVATKKGYPDKINGVTLTPGLPFSQIGAIDGDDDCTHFLSCCVGKWKRKITLPNTQLPEIEFRGGGLDLSSPFASVKVYGETYAPRLVGALIMKGARVIDPKDGRRSRA